MYLYSRTAKKPVTSGPYSGALQPRHLRMGAVALGVMLGSWMPTLAQAQVLESLLTAALETHPATVSQRAVISSAEASLESARWQFFPTPSASVESVNTSATDPAYRGSTQVSTLRLQQPLWTAGRLAAGTDKAEAGLNYNQAGLQEVRQQLSGKVLQAYTEWLSAHLKTRANEASQASHVRLREQVQRRLEEGIAAQSDVVLAQGRLDTINADVTASKAMRDIALARLGQLVGKPLEAPALESALANPKALMPNPQTVIEQALSISPTLQKAKHFAQQQLAVVNERNADLKPEVYARLERQYGNFSYANAAPESRFFVGLTSRFGAGLSTASNLQAARAQYDAAVAEIDVQTRLVNEQVSSDLVLAQSGQSRIASMEIALSAVKELAESYDRQFLAGRKSWLDVMNAARELAQTETQLADLVSTQVLVTWRLVLNTGGVDAIAKASP